ncbi:PH domain-containing protein [Halovibrio sp. HP20-50]|jgi:uncharacterized membrane protein YdbT with pleckstrin-like domain|uniref:PH domain-containing protein n=1 Tax=Halovibrio sp. HP20-59 TaxID=3080275 RepID=UPI00294AB2B0|nr:PH domain-containing protein [Halovibrio sp. HP20-59]MEA2118801.1 PH domain-containing protein [Halovibrio sp. HP20-59]
MNSKTTFRVSHRALLGHWLLVPLGAVLHFAPHAPFALAGANAPAPLTNILSWAGMGLAAWGLLNVAYQRLAHEYAIGSDRVIERHGIIARRVTPLFIHHIRSTEVHQTIVGRLLGYGTVEMSAAGTSTSEARFDRVANPMKVMASINNHLESLEAGTGGE